MSRRTAEEELSKRREQTCKGSEERGPVWVPRRVPWLFNIRYRKRHLCQPILLSPLVIVSVSWAIECSHIHWVRSHSLSARLPGLWEMDVDINMEKTLPSRNMKEGRALMEMMQSSLGDRQGHPDNICGWTWKGRIIPHKDLGKLLQESERRRTLISS